MGKAWTMATSLASKGTSWALLFVGLAATVMVVVVKDSSVWEGMLRSHMLTNSFLDCISPSNWSATYIAGTKLQGEVAVSRFRHHVDCFSNSGKWVLDPKPRYMATNVFGSRSLGGCEEKFLQGGKGGVSGDAANEMAARGSDEEWIVRQELKWEWRSDEEACRMLDFDRREFCRRVGARRNVLVVGDSMNQEIFWILLNHLVVNKTGWKLPRSAGEKHSQGDREVCEDVLGAGQGFRIGHIRNDRLSLIQRVVEDRKSNFLEYPWTSFVEPWNISIFILNKGAHFESDANFTESLINTFATIKYRWPAALVFYRNTPPGHFNCTAYHQPLEERQSKEMLPRHYKWGEFAQQNDIAKRITESFGYVYLDLDGMIALRPDGHVSSRDCLHYCLPGPLDVFAKLLYNTLLLLDPSRPPPVPSSSS